MRIGSTNYSFKVLGKMRESYFILLRLEFFVAKQHSIISKRNAEGKVYKKNHQHTNTQ